jgi:hypothetical protein
MTGRMIKKGLLCIACVFCLFIYCEFDDDDDHHHDSNDHHHSSLRQDEQHKGYEDDFASRHRLPIRGCGGDKEALILNGFADEYR